MKRYIHFLLISAASILNILLLLTSLVPAAVQAQLIPCSASSPGAQFISNGAGGSSYMCPSGVNPNASMGQFTTPCSASSPGAQFISNGAGGGSYMCPSSSAQNASAPFCQNGICTYTPLEPLPGQPAAGAGNALTFAQYVTNIFTLAIVIGAMVAVAVLVFSGITYMMSEALPSKEWGRRKMKQALWALLLLLGSYLILFTINPNLTIFSAGGTTTTVGGGISGSTPINPLQSCLFISQVGSPPQTGCSPSAGPQVQSAAQLQQQTQCPGGYWNTNLNPPACSTL